jgi:NAD(P)-dependent dehydrogenase (short-subunit alcohol dehydrogenase family)
VRAVVVGASSGLGRSVGIGLAQRGAEVALLSRRIERVQVAAAEAGNGAFAVECDATSEESCRSAIAEAVQRLGGIDALVYTAAISPLVRVADTDADTWRACFDTNVTGAALVTTAALPHLQASGGRAIYFSSLSASVTPPWPGLGAYIVSKAALDKLVEVWGAEHPEVGFTSLVIGECLGGEGDAQTELATGWDAELASEVVPIWMERHYLSGEMMNVDDLIGVVDAIVRSGSSISMPSVIVAPRPGSAGMGIDPTT